MLRFLVFRDGQPAPEVDLSGAHLLGSDGVPLRADISYENGQIICRKRAPGPAGLAIPWTIAKGGRMLFETTKLPERERPYILQVELLRGRLMRIAQKREDWGLYEFDGVDEVANQVEAARDLLIECLQADTPEHAAQLADKGLVTGLRAAEGLTAFHAEIFYCRRKQVGGFPKRLVGCVVDPMCTDEAYRSAIASTCDYITIPFNWRRIEPKEQAFHWKPYDLWVDWAAKNKIGIRGGSLVSFTETHIPDWSYIWEHDFETLRDLVVENVRRVIRRYGRHVFAWEVVSGLHAGCCFSFNFEQLIELTRTTVAAAKQLSPSSTAVIDLVAPWGEYYALNQRTIPPMLYAEMAMQSGIHFDAFGVQCYMGVGADGMYVRDIFHLSSMLDRFSAFGKPVHITGIGVPSGTEPDPQDAWQGRIAPQTGGTWHMPWSEDLQKAWMRRVYHIALSKPYIDCISWRDFSDAADHYLPHGGLLRQDGSPKPALAELRTIRDDVRGGEKPTAAVHP